MKKNLNNRLFRFLILVLLLFPATGCERTFIDDLFDIHEEIDVLKDSHSNLKQRLDNLQASITTIQAIVDILSAGYYIESVSPIRQDGVDTGYLFHFTNGLEIKIFHGIDAIDGNTPVISVILVDGNYYWTLDGIPLRDDDGEIIPVISDTVKTPAFTISNGYWYLSTDGGKTWKLYGKATGDDGLNGEYGVEHIIRVDTSSSDKVVFILADGTAISIPYRIEIRLELDSDEGEIGIAGRETIRVGYSLSSATENTVVNVSSNGYYSAKVNPIDRLSGTIEITCPRTFSDGFVNVMVYDKTGIVDTRIIRFYEKKIEFSQGMEFSVPSDGGVIGVPFRVNFPFHVAVDADAASWLEIPQTAFPGDSEEQQIEVIAAKNTGTSRTGALYIFPDNSDQVFAAIFITQQSTYCTIDIGSFLVSYEGGTVLSHVTTPHGVIAGVPEEDRGWLRAEVMPAGDERYTVAITAEPNPESESRSSSIELTASDGFLPLASIRIRQNGRNLDLEYALIFIVNPNYSNDFTAYLPIDLNSEFDCFVDWGDGTGMRYRSSDDFNAFPAEQRNVHHRYDGLDIGRSFEVVVTGTVTSLCADYIPQALRSSVTEVKQWGKTGLRRMYRAFAGFTGLTTLHLDETGAFEKVEEFRESFQECPRLITLSGHLFDHATSARSFDYTFNECHKLAVIPEDLFDNASSAESFCGTFQNCMSLTAIPEKLFAHCDKVKSFAWTFSGCKALRSIPSGLFSHNQEVSSFHSVFRECTSLTSLPDRLFDGNPEASDFRWAFSLCQRLGSIPASLLDKQRKITLCDSMFNGCTSLTGESPWTLIEGRKVHLYERKDYPDCFAFPLRYSFCFYKCGSLSDYPSIPQNWIHD